MGEFRDLAVWKRSTALVLEVYSVTRRFPRTEERGLQSQMRRAAVSIPSNISEGEARSSRRDHARFVEHALGSANELETQLYLSARLGFISTDRSEVLMDDLREIVRMLRKMIGYLRG